MDLSLNTNMKIYKRKSINESVRSHLSMLKGIGHDSTIVDFLIKYGKNYNQGDKTYLGKRGQQKLCFMNAGRLALSDPDLTYVEGYMEFLGIPLEHAWVIDKQNNVIDPTLPNGKGVTEYYGVPLKTDWFQKFILKNKYWGVFGYRSHKTLLTLKPETGVQK